MSNTTPQIGKSRPRRIVKRTAWTVAGIVALFAWYMLSYGATHWCLGYGLLHAFSGNGAERLAHSACWVDETFYAPLNGCADSDWPGADVLASFRWWCFLNGLSGNQEYVSWEDARRDVKLFDP